MGKLRGFVEFDRVNENYIRNSSMSIGTSNLFELNPAKWQSFIKPLISDASSEKFGLSLTISSVIPWITDTFTGIGIVGLISQVFESSLLSILILTTEISTIRSLVTLTPVSYTHLRAHET